MLARVAIEDEWLGGWDDTPGIVSVWAEPDGHAVVWRRVEGTLVREDLQFRPWIVVAHREDVRDSRIAVRELEGEGKLRWLARADDLPTLTRALLTNASKRLGHELGHVRDLGDDAIVLAPEEQYLAASGRTYFRGLAFDDVRRMQIDLETTGLDPGTDRIFLIATRDPDGRIELLEGDNEAELIARLVEKVRACDPDVIENHNLHGFDLGFLDRRADRWRIPLELGRLPGPMRQRGARRGIASGEYKVRLIAPGRELIDTMDAVMRHDFATRELPGHGLKAVAKALGIAADDRELVRGDQIHTVYLKDPERIRRYASADVEEVAHLSKKLGGAAFALATMVPRRYERLADAGAATGVIDPLLVRAYLRSNAAIPHATISDGTEHNGAALHLYAAGVAKRVVKADVASLYPSLMRSFRIGPSRDRLHVLLAVVDRLVERRLAAKAAGNEAMSAAMKLVVNSAYGYLAAPGLTRFADVHAANEVTRRGRELLDVMCTQLAARGVTLLEADTDGVYFAVPESWSEADERRIVTEVGAAMPPLVKLEYEGRYAAMLSHEPKNYALLGYDGKLTLRGVAFRSSRAEPFGEAFLRAAVRHLLEDDVVAVQRAYIAAITALRARALPTYDVSSRVRLTKSPDEYLAVRESRRELTYEAMLSSGHKTWRVGERVRVYRTTTGASTVADPDDDTIAMKILDPRDYDVEHYVRLLRDTYASRLARAFTPDDVATLFDDPDQLSLFGKPLSEIRSVLVRIP